MCASADPNSLLSGLYFVRLCCILGLYSYLFGTCRIMLCFHCMLSSSCLGLVDIEMCMENVEPLD